MDQGNPHHAKVTFPPKTVLSAMVRIKNLLAHPFLESILRDMRRSDCLSGNEFQRLRKVLLSRSLEAAAEVPYYRRLFEKHAIDPRDPGALSQLPILTRREAQEHLEEMINPSYMGSRRLVITSGSTGTPARFLRTRYALDWGYASGMRCKEWWRMDPGLRTLRLWGRSPSFSRSHWVRTCAYLADVKDLLVGVRNIGAYDLSSDKIRESWSDIIRWAPRIIHGYATSVYLLARFVQEAALDARLLGIRAIILESEKVYSFQRSLIREVFGCPVLEWYGCCEVGVIATPCPAGRLHIREDMVHLEVVDGSIILTTLHERAMPLVRYCLGDEGVVDSLPCSCGLPSRVLSHIDGRTHDLVQKPDGGFVHGELCSHVVEQLSSVRKFRVVQKALDSILVQIEAAHPLTPEERTSIRRQLRVHLGEDVRVSVEEVGAIPTDKSGKFRWVVSEIRAGRRGESPGSLSPEHSGS